MASARLGADGTEAAVVTAADVFPDRPGRRRPVIVSYGPLRASCHEAHIATPYWPAAMKVAMALKSNVTDSGLKSSWDSVPR
jgi:hypothetical protein